jgi:hypothetical protein
VLAIWSGQERELAQCSQVSATNASSEPIFSLSCLSFARGTLITWKKLAYQPDDTDGRFDRNCETQRIKRPRVQLSQFPAA